MATAVSSSYQADLTRYLDHKVLRLAQRHVVLGQLAEKIKIPENQGMTYTATRWNRLALPFAPLVEGVAPSSQAPTISQVTGIALQWGAKVNVTDIANMTIEHPVVDQAIKLLGYQVPETYERNLWNQLVSGTQVNYVNQRGARASLVAGDVLDPTTVNRTFVNLQNLGCPMANGPTETVVKRGVNDSFDKQKRSPESSEHMVAVGSPLPINGDFRQNSTVVNAWSYSDVDKLYNNEAGQWAGIRFVVSNMTPSWTGVAAVTAASSGSGGTLTTGTYAVQVTASDAQNQYESLIYQVQTGLSVTSPAVITLTTPSTAGYTYSVYVSQPGSTVIANLGASVSGPTDGPYAGMAVQIPPSTAVTITGLGLMQIPPAAPATGVTVFPTLVFGEDAFAMLEMEKIKWTRLFEADKSDPLNQLRVVGWKGWQGVVIKNQNFMARIESSASFTGAFG